MTDKEFITLLQTTAIAFVAAIITTLVNNAIQRRQSKRHRAEDAAEEELRQRINPHCNIVRDNEERSTRTGRPTVRKNWYVNPFRIVFDGDGTPSLMSQPDFRLEERSYESKGGIAVSVHIPLTRERVEKCRNRKEWMVFTEFSDVLTYQEVQPCGSEDAFLFQPVPKTKKPRFLKRE